MVGHTIAMAAFWACTQGAWATVESAGAAFAVEPSVAVAGKVVEARAQGGFEGRWAVLDAGGRRVAFEVGADGVLRFVPESAGVYRIVMSGPETAHLRTIEVVGASARWLYGLGCVPLGVALLVVHRRRRAT